MSDVIVVEQTEIVVVRDVQREVIEVAAPGPIGPRGPQGPSGGGGDSVVDPHEELFLIANLAPGLTQDVTAAAITNGTLGVLAGVDVGSSIPLRVDIQVVNGGRVTRTTIYTMPGQSEPWRPPSPQYVSVEATGAESFGLEITNLSVFQTADVRATIYWDEE